MVFTGRRRLGLGLALMTAGSLSPWATANTWHDGVVPASGIGHGGEVVLVLCVLIVLSLVARAHVVAAALALLATAWIALIAYELPGSLTAGGAWQANLAWGIGIALLGSVLVTIAARRSRAD
jgi:hypothetical protein